MDANMTTAQLKTRDQETVQRLATWLVTQIPCDVAWCARTLDFRPAPRGGVDVVCSQVTVDGADRVEWSLPADHGAARWIDELHTHLTSPDLGAWSHGRLEVFPGAEDEFSVAVIFRFEEDEETF